MKLIVVLRGLCILVLTMVFAPSNNTISSSDNVTCSPVTKSLDTLEIPTNSGRLMYRPFNEDAGGQPNINSSVTAIRLPVANPVISPNGLYILSLYSPDPTDNIREVIVFDRMGQTIYSGAPARGASQYYWLGDDQVLSFAYTRIARDSSLRSYFQMTYLIIDPFEQAYTAFQPELDSFFYIGNDPIMLYEMTYDGRYMLYLGRGAFDFIEQRVIELENYEVGIPSTTSYRFLVVEYSSNHYLPDAFDEGPHPVAVYDLNSDTLTQISTLSVDRPVNSFAFSNSWSPDEALWAYTLYYANEDLESFRRIDLLDVETGQTRQTCFGVFFNTRVLPINNSPSVVDQVFLPDFAWSRDSRYLALQGVIEGQEMDESLGVYIYDTQTEEIYLVHQGRADIIGWMQSPQ